MPTGINDKRTLAFTPLDADEVITFVLIKKAVLLLERQFHEWHEARPIIPVFIRAILASLSKE